jgi:hypothetical protein
MDDDAAAEPPDNVISLEAIKPHRDRMAGLT